MIWIQGMLFGNWVKPDWSLQTNTTPHRSHDWCDIAFVMKTAALLVWFLGKITIKTGKTSSTRSQKGEQNCQDQQAEDVLEEWQLIAMTCTSTSPVPMVFHPPQEGTKHSYNTQAILGPSAQHIISSLMILTYGNGTGTNAFISINHSHLFCLRTMQFRSE